MSGEHLLLCEIRNSLYVYFLFSGEFSEFQGIFSVQELATLLHLLLSFNACFGVNDFDVELATIKPKNNRFIELE